MTTGKSGGLLLALLNADSEEAVLAELKKAHVWEDPSCWRNLGGSAFESNIGIVQNQQVLASAALVEKLVNAADSVLMRAAGERGIDPKGKLAPKSMKQAVELFFNVKNGDIATLDARQRTNLAEKSIALVATGGKRPMCLSIIDQGEGQGPDYFERTFLKLCGDYKQAIPFVQGRFHMGGTGVIPYCGQGGFQLIVSRRCPAMLRPGENPAWGWTCIRRNPPRDYRPSVYEYLVLDGQVPFLNEEPLPLWPDDKQAFVKPLPFGTAVKLFDYQLEQAALYQKITMDLQNQLARRLFDMPIPIRLYERRIDRMEGHSSESTFSGMRSRICGLESADGAHKTMLEEGFPTTGQLNFEGRYQVPVWVLVLSREGLDSRRVRERFTTASQAVLLTVNGQTHASYGKQFYTTNRLGLDYIKDDLLTVLDCTSLPMELRENIFMGSRDRPRESGHTTALKAELEKWLHDHDGLRTLNRKRHSELIHSTVSEDSSMKDVFKKLISSSPALKSLFGIGSEIRLPDPGKIRGEPVFTGVRYPTHFDFEGGDDSQIAKSCPENSYCKVFLRTDAENNYFTRVDDPGSIDIQPQAAYRSYSLWNGKLTVTLQPLPGAHNGHRFPIEVRITDGSRIEPFVKVVDLEITSAVQDTNGRKSGKPSDTHTGLELPDPMPVYRAGWDDHGFDERSGISLRSKADGGRGYDVFINMDNVWLKQAKSRYVRDSSTLLVDRRYQVGMMVLSYALMAELSRPDIGKLSLLTTDGGEADDKEIVSLLSRSLSQIVLPLFDGIAKLADARLVEED